MPLPLARVGTTNGFCPNNTTPSNTNHLEPVKLDDRKEVHVGSLGLGTALAVAYDLYNDTSTTASQMASHIYSPQLGGFISLATMKSTNGSQMTHLRTTPMQQDIQAQQNCYNPAYVNNSWINQPSDAYLTPIAVSSSSDLSSSPGKSFAVVSNNSGTRLRLPKTSTDGETVSIYIDPNHHQSPIVTASADVHPCSTTNNSTSAFTTIVSTHVPLLSSSLSTTALPASTTTLSAADAMSTEIITTTARPPLTTTQRVDSKTNSDPVDESLYEISDEEMREIDASLASNPDVMASRQWKYYIETNEWTRATCALMACLFTRDQMANSTVLGRGGSQRARLPSNLVAFVVGTIRKRFNKPAAAVRARMAQKCKDERRFGRLTVTGTGSGYSVDGHDPGTPAPVAAISSKQGGARKARKRPAPNSQGHPRPSKSSNGSTPPSDFASTPGYQPTAYTDDACSSTTDSNQLPPLALSPCTDPGQDLYLRPDETQMISHVVPNDHHQPVHTLSMMLMVPNLEVIQQQPTSPVVEHSLLGASSSSVNTSSHHVPASTELAS